MVTRSPRWKCVFPYPGLALHKWEPITRQSCLEHPLLTVFCLSLSSSVLNLSFFPLVELATPFRPKTQISLSFLRAPRQPDLQSGDRNLNISVIIYSEKLQRQVDVRLTKHARGALSLICFAWRSSSLPDSSLDSVIMEETLGEE